EWNITFYDYFSAASSLPGLPPRVVGRRQTRRSDPALLLLLVGALRTYAPTISAFSRSNTARKATMFSWYGGRSKGSRPPPPAAVPRVGLSALSWGVPGRTLPGRASSDTRRQKRLQLLLGFLHERKRTHPSPLLLPRERIPVAGIAHRRFGPLERGA